MDVLRASRPNQSHLPAPPARLHRPRVRSLARIARIARARTRRLIPRPRRHRGRLDEPRERLAPGQTARRALEQEPLLRRARARAVRRARVRVVVGRHGAATRDARRTSARARLCGDEDAALRQFAARRRTRGERVGARSDATRGAAGVRFARRARGRRAEGTSAARETNR